MARPSYLARRGGGRYFLQIRLGKQPAKNFDLALLRVSLRGRTELLCSTLAGSCRADVDPALRRPVARPDSGVAGRRVSGAPRTCNATRVHAGLMKAIISRLEHFPSAKTQRPVACICPTCDAADLRSDPHEVTFMP